MQTEPYVVLRPFMVEELGLKGSELVSGISEIFIQNM